MIFISLSYLKNERLEESIKDLAVNGFKNIELSAGSGYWEGCEESLLGLKEDYSLNYLLHNYFPRPKEDFILNMASLDDEIYERTILHYEKAITLSRKLGCSKYALHAGYYVDLKMYELGENVKFRQLNDKEKALHRFVDGFKTIQKKAGEIDLYVENNVLSKNNYDIFKGNVPFMLVDSDGYNELSKLVDFKLLLDVGHLKISTNSLGLVFAEEIDKLINISDYIHLSDNDGFKDNHEPLKKGSQIFDVLKEHDLNGKTLTLETRCDIPDIKASVSIIEGIWR